MNKKTLGIIFFFIILIAVPLVVFLSQQSQDVRQRASEFQYSQPSNYAQWPTCEFPDPRSVSNIFGIKGCVGKGMVDGKAVAKITNESSVTHKVGIASYKAYQEYREPEPFCAPADCPDKWNFVWTQSLYDSKDNISIVPGQTVYLNVNVPACAWEVNIFTGSTMQKFSPPNTWYYGENRLIDRWFSEEVTLCSSDSSSQGASSTGTQNATGGQTSDAGETTPSSSVIRSDMLE